MASAAARPGAAVPKAAPAARKWTLDWEKFCSTDHNTGVIRIMLDPTENVRSGLPSNFRLDDTQCEEFAAWFAQALPGIVGSEVHEYIADITMSNNNIGDKGVTTLMNTLSKQGLAIKILKLYKNNIGDNGVKAIGDFIEACTEPVWELHLSHNNITARGCCSLLALLSRHQSYPRTNYERRNRELVPLWLRLEKNSMHKTAELLSFVRQKGVRVCTEKDRRLCGPQKCQHSSGTDCPLVHMYVFDVTDSNDQFNTAKLKTTPASSAAASRGVSGAGGVSPEARSAVGSSRPRTEVGDASLPASPNHPIARPKAALSHPAPGVSGGSTGSAGGAASTGAPASGAASGRERDREVYSSAFATDGWAGYSDDSAFPSLGGSAVASRETSKAGAAVKSPEKQQGGTSLQYRRVVSPSTTTATTTTTSSSADTHATPAATAAPAAAAAAAPSTQTPQSQKAAAKSQQTSPNQRTRVERELWEKCKAQLDTNPVLPQMSGGEEDEDETGKKDRKKDKRPKEKKDRTKAAAKSGLQLQLVSFDPLNPNSPQRIAANALTHQPTISDGGPAGSESPQASPSLGSRSSSILQESQTNTPAPAATPPAATPPAAASTAPAASSSASNSRRVSAAPLVAGSLLAKAAAASAKSVAAASAAQQAKAAARPLEGGEAASSSVSMAARAVSEPVSISLGVSAAPKVAAKATIVGTPAPKISPAGPAASSAAGPPPKAPTAEPAKQASGSAASSDPPLHKASPLILSPAKAAGPAPATAQATPEAAPKAKAALAGRSVSDTPLSTPGGPLSGVGTPQVASVGAPLKKLGGLGLNPNAASFVPMGMNKVLQSVAASSTGSPVLSGSSGAPTPATHLTPSATAITHAPLPAAAISTPSGKIGFAPAAATTPSAAAPAATPSPPAPAPASSVPPSLADRPEPFDWSSIILPPLPTSLPPQPNFPADLAFARGADPSWISSPLATHPAMALTPPTLAGPAGPPLPFGPGSFGGGFGGMPPLTGPAGMFMGDPMLGLGPDPFGPPGPPPGPLGFPASRDTSGRTGIIGATPFRGKLPAPTPADAGARRRSDQPPPPPGTTVNKNPPPPPPPEDGRSLSGSMGGMGMGMGVGGGMMGAPALSGWAGMMGGGMDGIGFGPMDDFGGPMMGGLSPNSMARRGFAPSPFFQPPPPQPGLPGPPQPPLAADPFTVPPGLGLSPPISRGTPIQLPSQGPHAIPPLGGPGSPDRRGSGHGLPASSVSGGGMFFTPMPISQGVQQQQQQQPQGSLEGSGEGSVERKESVGVAGNNSFDLVQSMVKHIITTDSPRPEGVNTPPPAETHASQPAPLSVTIPTSEERRAEAANPDPSPSPEPSPSPVSPGDDEDRRREKKEKKEKKREGEKDREKEREKDREDKDRKDKKEKKSKHKLQVVDFYPE